MFFKNLTVFQITKEVLLSLDGIEEALSENEFSSCLSSQMSSQGWCKPLGNKATMFTHTIDSRTMICHQVEEKIMPAAAINAKLNDKVELIEEEQARKLSRREKSDLKEEIIFDLLPKALSKFSRIYAYFDFKHNLFIVDTASATKAENIVTQVREAFGSFPVIPLTPKSLPVQTMTGWQINQEAPKGYSFGDNCLLNDLSEPDNKARFTGHDILGDEVIDLLRGGMSTKEIGLNHREKVSFTLTDKLTFKKLYFGDLVVEMVEAEEFETPAEKFDVDFSIMSSQIIQVIHSIMDALGGFSEIASSEEQTEITGLNNTPKLVPVKDYEDELYPEATAFTIETGKASISSLQRKLRIGYNRAARMVERMERDGVVSEMSHDGKREVL